MRAAAAFLSLVLLAACGDDPYGSGPSTTDTTIDLTPTTVPSGRLQGLFLELTLDDDTLGPGEETRSHIHRRNDTDRPIEDAGCTLANHRFGIVPVDDPDAPLGGESMTDCSGEAFVMAPGYDETYEASAFVPIDAEGDPLPPGDYLAVIVADDGNVVLRAPLTVVEA